MSLLIALLTVISAHAIENFDGCHTLLTIDSDVQVALGPDQIALTGSLGTDGTGYGPTGTYVIRDEHLEREVTGAGWLSQFALSPDDQLYLLDERGDVSLSGFFDVAWVDDVDRRGPGELRGFAHQPLLRRAPRGRSVIDRRDLARMFDEYGSERRRAVVVQTVNEHFREYMRREIKPWFDLHQRRPRPTTEAYGKLFAMKSFEEGVLGPLSIKRVPYAPGLGLPPYGLEVGVRQGKRTVRAHEGSRLALFDADRNLLGFVPIDRRLTDREEILRKADSALLIYPRSKPTGAP